MALGAAFTGAGRPHIGSALLQSAVLGHLRMMALPGRAGEREHPIKQRLRELRTKRKKLDAKLPIHFCDKGRPLCGAAERVNARSSDDARVTCPKCRKQRLGIERLK